MVKVGDVVEYAEGLRASVENIYLISSGEFVNEKRYNGNGYDIMLMLNDSMGNFNICFRDKPHMSPRK